MLKLDTKINDAGKLLAFATLFFGKEKRIEAEALVEGVLSRAVEVAVHSPMPAGIDRTLTLFADAHERLEQGCLQKATRMSRAALREVGPDITGLLALPGAQREMVILTKCVGFTYEEVVKITGRPIGTIRSRLNRAYHALADAGLADAAQQ